jgi:hypothetical protein
MRRQLDVFPFQLGNLRLERADDGLNFGRLAGADFFRVYYFAASCCAVQPAPGFRSIAEKIKNCFQAVNGYAGRRNLIEFLLRKDSIFFLCQWRLGRSGLAWWGARGRRWVGAWGAAT